MKKRWATNFFIVVFIALVLIDTLPGKLFRHQPLKKAVDPILDVSGLWQGEWNLFSPVVDSENHRLEVEFVFSDGSTHRWQSIDWSKASSLEKFRRVREVEFYDRVRNQSAKDAWSSFAQYALENYAPDSIASPLVEIRLAVLSEWVSPPGRGGEEETSRVVFHTEPVLP